MGKYDGMSGSYHMCPYFPIIDVPSSHWLTKKQGFVNDPACLQQVTDDDGRDQSPAPYFFQTNGHPDSETHGDVRCPKMIPIG